MYVKQTKEGKLTDAFDKYCHKHNIPMMSGVNGPRVPGWNSIPDRIIGTSKDDLLTKCILIEIKPTREAALKDLEKSEYKVVKYLAILYYKDVDGFS